MSTTISTVVSLASDVSGLERLEKERDRLAAEYRLLSASASTREACSHLVQHVESAREPLAASNASDNPWTRTASDVHPTAGCCVVS